ncbi:putative serine/threonine-protein kinase [Hamiltosporidium magnivora]|uniref:Putative serine/threonine-protein kinase n=1 Tax=Hamiltosporidium magnivora TaxID=148818 RepID=A0A4Q9LNL0_9MICR|nr:putative serine/threonine-protein kinase [Hamiltosporidium magnivora]
MKFFRLKIIHFFVHLHIFLCKKPKRDQSYVLKKCEPYLSNDGYYAGEYISSGRSSYVYSFKSNNLKKKVAIKIGRTKKYKNTLSNEMHFLKIIEHENIIKFEEDFVIGKRKCIVMPFYETNLYNYFSKLKSEDIRKKEILVQILKALAYLHSQNIIHNDIKSDNVLIDKDLNIKLSDFGLSCYDGKPCKIFFELKFEENEGKYYHYSPEIRMDEIYGVKTDMWSFGCLFFWIYSGKNLEKSTKPAVYLNYDCYRFFCYFLKKNPELRLSSYAALFSDFFDDLYGFVFCFCKENDFTVENNNCHYKKISTKLSVTCNETNFTIHCKCSEKSTLLFTSKKKEMAKQDSYWFESTRINEFKFGFASEFAVEITSETYLLPELSHSKYRLIRRTFEFLKITLKDQKRNKRRNIKRIIKSRDKFGKNEY